MPLTGSYEILDELGRGAAGIVFRARSRATGELVAIKVLHDPRDGDPAALGSRQRLLREAAILARIDHPNVVRIVEVDAGRDGASLVTELVDGGSLRDLLDERGGRLGLHEAASLVAQAARALHALHEQGLVHRDIKPENLLLASDGTLKITDFGIAAHLLERRDADAGYLLGTPSYVAPEQLSGRSVDPRADLWSLGALLFECLAGRPPFEGEGAGDVAKRIVQERAPRLDSLVPGCAPALSDLVAEALDPSPARRPPSGLELARRIESAVIPGPFARDSRTARTRLRAASRALPSPSPARPRSQTLRAPRRRASRRGQGVALTILATLLLAFAARETGLVAPNPVPPPAGAEIEGPAGAGGIALGVLPGPAPDAPRPGLPVVRVLAAEAAPPGPPEPEPEEVRPRPSRASRTRPAPRATEPAARAARAVSPPTPAEARPRPRPALLETAPEPRQVARAADPAPPTPDAADSAPGPEPTRSPDRGPSPATSGPFAPEAASRGTLLVEIEHPLAAGAIEVLVDGRPVARLRIGALLEAPPGRPAIALAGAEAGVHEVEARIRGAGSPAIEAVWSSRLEVGKGTLVVRKLRLHRRGGAWRLLPL